MKYGKNTPFDIIEFGPGRGSLMTSVLISLSKFPAASSLFRHLRLIELSDSLRKQQESAISSVLKTCHSKPDVTWHSSLDEIPTGLTSFYLANEFLDALPIHRFQKVDGKWREVFVDAINPSNPNELGDHLAFVTSPSDTMASTTYLPFIDDLSEKTTVEVCPEGGALVQKIASRIAADGGSALVVDYGHVGERQDTLRAFKNHELHDPLKDPGQADITADVDFAFLKRSVEASNNAVVVHGPVSQAYFLVHMGILLRLKNLVARTKNEEEKQKLIASTEMLIGTNQMGKRFKFMAITAGRSEKEKQNIPAGFYPTWQTSDEEQSAS
nr:protein midA mitochondrial [Hymenolepis microstoma]